MNRYNLVVLKNDRPYQHNEHIEFKPFKYYRCLPPEENESMYMIYAEWFTQAEFDYLFEYAYDNYVRVFEGDMLPVDQQFVQFGNWGTPIGYSNLRSL